MASEEFTQDEVDTARSKFLDMFLDRQEAMIECYSCGTQLTARESGAPKDPSDIIQRGSVPSCFSCWDWMRDHPASKCPSLERSLSAKVAGRIELRAGEVLLDPEEEPSYMTRIAGEYGWSVKLNGELWELVRLANAHDS